MTSRGVSRVAQDWRCINDTKTLYSGGGRLYCLSRLFDYSMKFLR